MNYRLHNLFLELEALSDMREVYKTHVKKEVVNMRKTDVDLTDDERMSIVVTRDDSRKLYSKLMNLYFSIGSSSKEYSKAIELEIKVQQLFEHECKAV